MIIIASYSNVSVTYTADGTQTVFSFPFDYLRKAFVFVEVDEETILTQGTDYSVSEKTVVFTTTPAAGTVLRIYRQTDTKPLVSWADASVLRAKDMTVQQIQELHILEETQEWAREYAIIRDGEEWNARNFPIKNVGDPVDDKDALNKQYLEAEAIVKDDEGTHWIGQGLPLENIATPGKIKDATTKEYVDKLIDKLSVEADRYVIFNTVAAMKAADLPAGYNTRTLGYYDINDGGAGTYSIRGKVAGETEDAGTVIFLDNDNVAELIVDGRINVLKLGLKRNDNTFDNGAVLQSFLDKHDCTLPVLYFPKGNYTFLTGITLNYQVTFLGDYFGKTEAGEPQERIVNTTRFFFSQPNSNLITNHSARSSLNNIIFNSPNDFTVDSEDIITADMLPYNRFHYIENVENINCIYTPDDLSNAPIYCNNCAFIGFSKAIYAKRLLQIRNCTFNKCNIDVEVNGASHYFYNCSFSHSNYAIIAHAHAISIYGCWFDVIGEHAVYGGDTDDVNSGVYGYIEGTFDYINKSAIYAYSSVNGLIINAKFGKCGLYYSSRDPEQDVTESMSNFEKFNVYAGASAISIMRIFGATINAVNFPIAQSNGLISPKYMLNCWNCKQGLLNYTGKRDYNGNILLTDISPLYRAYTTSNHIIVNNGEETIFNKNASKAYNIPTRNIGTSTEQNLTIRLKDTPQNISGFTSIMCTGKLPNGTAGDVITLTTLNDFLIKNARPFNLYNKNAGGTPIAYVDIDTTTNAVKITYLQNVTSATTSSVYGGY